VRPEGCMEVEMERCWSPQEYDLTVIMVVTGSTY